MGKPSAPKSTTNQTSHQVSTATPWDPAIPAFTNLVTQAGTALGATPKTPTFTGPNATQLQAVDMLKAAAPWTASGVNAMADNAGKTAGGYYLNPDVNPALRGSGYHESINPGLQGMIKAAINPLHDQLDANVLSIGDAAKLAGAYGGDRQELLKGTALSRFNRDAMDVGSMYSFNANEAMQNRMFQANQGDASRAAAGFATERNNQMNAGQLFQDTNTLALKPAEIYSALGDQQAGWDAARVTAAADAPWAGLDKYASLLGTVAPFGTTVSDGTSKTVTKGTPGGGGLQGGISGALGGASAGAAFGPWGAGIGAIAGGLGGLFG